MIFEKKGKSSLSRHLWTKGKTLHILFSQDASKVFELKLKLPRTSDISDETSFWSDSFRQAGFTEFLIQDGHAGSVAYIDPENESGRIRADAFGDVYFSQVSNHAKSAKQSLRVLVHDVFTNPELDVPFMFGYKLEASKVTNFPKGQSHSIQEIPEKKRVTLLKKLGTLLDGSKRSDEKNEFTPGQLIFAYQKGIHRYLGKQKKTVYYEEIYNSKLLRQPGFVYCSIAEFCHPVPEEILKQL